MSSASAADQRGIIEPPRRSPWVIALDLYKAGGSFRGFLEFALIGTVVLAFLSGGSSSLGKRATSWMHGQKSTASSSSAPTPADTVPRLAKPTIPLAPRIADVRIEPSYFDNAPEPLRTQLRTALRAYYARNPVAASKAMGGADPDDRYALLMRGLNLLSIPGATTVHTGLSLLENAADKGEPRAMAVLGVLKVSGLPGVGRDPAAGRALLERAAAAGDAAAARVIGEGFVTGWMGAIDPTRAEQYLRLASERGDLRGTLRLGEMLLTGHGVPKDEREGERLIRKAAIDGSPEAQAMYGTMRFLPYAGGLTDNPAEALEWLERAAAQSEPHAMYYLGMFYVEYGKRTGQLDPARGADLFRRCTEVSMHRDCVFAYATALDLGIGIPRDAVKAYALYSIAAANENASKARTRRDEIGKNLSQQQIVQAHQLTNELISRSSWKAAMPPPRVNDAFADRTKGLH